MALKVPGLEAVVKRFSRKRLEIPEERATSFGNLAAQMMGMIRAELEGPGGHPDPDSWHWLHDLYVDDSDGSTTTLFAVRVSCGRPSPIMFFPLWNRSRTSMMVDYRLVQPQEETVLFALWRIRHLVADFAG